jgi:hypothetical protein
LYQTLSGEAVLESHEPNVVVRVTAADRAGHMRVRLTSLLAAFPVRG